MRQTDFGFWGFALSVVALVLIIPLGIVVNILTPKVQNWWATTSQGRFSRRVAELKRTIEHPPSVLMWVLSMGSPEFPWKVAALA